METEGKLETDLFHIGLVMLVLGAVTWAVYDFLVSSELLKVTCVLHSLTGLYCPGCGGTRAFHALLGGRVILSAWYHPLVLYGAVVGGGFFLTQALHRVGLKCVKGWKFHNWYLYVGLFLTVGNFFLKNALLLICGIEM